MSWRRLWSSAATRRSDQRTRTFALGLGLLGIPTFFQIEPSALNWHAGARWPILGAWAVMAFAVVRGEMHRDEQLMRVSDARRSIVRQQRHNATNDVLEALLAPRTRDFPETYEFTVYVYDRDVDVLRPIWPYLAIPTGQQDPRIFPPGRGATGSAWSNKTTFVVTGDEVTNAVHGLTEDQQAYFAECRTAAATPMWGDAEEPFGVLTALSREDDKFLDADSARREFASLAATIGVVLQSVPDPGDLW